MSTRTDVLLWAQRILALSSAPANQLLELKTDASIEQAQEAFHKIARTSHPDIHRTGLTPEELEMVTLAYSRCAGAYQDFRSQRMHTTRMRPVAQTLTPGPVPEPAANPAPTAPRAAAPRAAAPGPVPSAPPATSGAGGSGAMNGKALIYYRKAELALRRGDLKGAMMQVKMAIAGDPQSQFLRSALVEIEAELAKKP